MADAENESSKGVENLAIREEQRKVLSELGAREDWNMQLASLRVVKDHERVQILSRMVERCAQQARMRQQKIDCSAYIKRLQDAILQDLQMPSATVNGYRDMGVR